MCFVVLLDVFGVVGIYRRKKYVGGASRGPRGMAFLIDGPSLLDLI